MVVLRFNRPANASRLSDTLATIPGTWVPSLDPSAPSGARQSLIALSVDPVAETLAVWVDDTLDASVSSAITAAVEAHDATPDPPAVVYAGERVLTDRVTTSGTTPATLFRATLRPLTAYVAHVELVGIDGGNGAMRTILGVLSAKRLNNGAVLVGSPSILANHADTGAATWTVTPSVSGNDFVISCAGSAGREVSWFVRLKVNEFTPGGQ